MSRRIEYGQLMHRAMRSLIKEVLQDVVAEGLPGEHHFFITIDTTHEGVQIAEWLRERYPEEITVVMQHWFDALEVGNDGFSVTLNFGDLPEPLYIPYDSILTFVDPSVEFGLRFETQEDEDTEIEELALVEDPVDEAPMIEEAEAEEEETGEVVSLDSFRK